MLPTKIQQPDASHLVMEWSDGRRTEYSVKDLRDRCPCATCREKRSQPVDSDAALLPVLSPQEAKPLTITAMKPVGNYAYSIEFSDGHNTGIYTFEQLLADGARGNNG